MERQRLRDLGFFPGELPTDPLNCITDVPGVQVGHATIVSGEGVLKPGAGPARTGVTVILPHDRNLYREKVGAAVHTINGYGKAAGFEQTRELGWIEAPIALTNTLNVGLVLDALIDHAVQNNPEIGIHPGSGSVNILVGETNDGFLNDLQGRHVKAEHVWAALEDASGGPILEGAVGAGTGTVCYGWKGGIGSASRVIPTELGGYMLGVLVQTNFGESRDLMILGAPVGRSLVPDERTPDPPGGSVMVVLGTDAPLETRQLERLCVRAQAGLARTGAQFSHGSGDFVIAFSTADRKSRRPKEPEILRASLGDEARQMNALFRAAIEGVEEAVLNSLTCAETVVGRDYHIARALPLDQLVEILRIRQS